VVCGIVAAGFSAARPEPARKRTAVHVVVSGQENRMAGSRSEGNGDPGSVTQVCNQLVCRLNGLLTGGPGPVAVMQRRQ